VTKFMEDWRETSYMHELGTFSARRRGLGSSRRAPLPNLMEESVENTGHESLLREKLTMPP